MCGLANVSFNVSQEEKRKGKKWLLWHVKQQNNWVNLELVYKYIFWFLLCLSYWRSVGKKLIQEEFLIPLVSLTATCGRHGHSSPVEDMVKWRTWKKNSFVLHRSDTVHNSAMCHIVKLDFSFSWFSSSLCFEAIFSQAVCSSTWLLISLNEMRGSFISIFIPLLLLFLLFHSSSTAVLHAGWTIG